VSSSKGAELKKEGGRQNGVKFATLIQKNAGNFQLILLGKGNRGGYFQKLRRRLSSGRRCHNGRSQKVTFLREEQFWNRVTVAVMSRRGARKKNETYWSGGNRRYQRGTEENDVEIVRMKVGSDCGKKGRRKKKRKT